MRATRPSSRSLAKSLAQRRAVGQVAAGHDQVVGHIPIEGFGDFKGRCLLPLQPIGVHGVEQVNRRLVHDLRQHANAAVEIGLQLAGYGAVIHGLRQLAPGNLSFGNQHQAAQPGARRIGGHRGRRVPGGGAGDPLESSLLGHAECRGHACVFEGAGGIHALMLGKELIDAERFGGAQSTDRAACCLRAV